MSRHIILVRHGHYAKVQHASDQERKLSVYGKDQVKLLADRMRSLGLVFDQILSSDCARAVQTTNLLQEHGVFNKDILAPEFTEMLRAGSPPVPPEPRLTKKKIKPEVRR